MSAIVPGGILDQHPSYLGGSAVIGPTAGPGNTERLSAALLRLEGAHKNITQTYILSFDLKERQNNTVVALSNHLVRARIQWASIKGRGDAVIDVKHGTRVTLEGTILSVDLSYVFSDEANFGRNGPDFQVTASVGLGSVGKGPQLTFTPQAGPIAALATILFDIPPYARQVVFQTTQTGIFPAPSLIFFSTNNPLSRIISLRPSGLNVITTIPNGAEAVGIDNTGPGTQVLSAIFLLNL